MLIALVMGVLALPGVPGLYNCPTDPPPNCPCNPCEPCPSNLMEMQLCYLLDEVGCGMQPALELLNFTCDQPGKIYNFNHRFHDKWCSAHTNVLFGPHPVLCYNASDDANNGVQDGPAAAKGRPSRVPVGACPKDKSTNDNRINIITNFYKNTKKMTKEELKKERKEHRRENKKKGFSKGKGSENKENRGKGKGGIKKNDNDDETL